MRPRHLLRTNKNQQLNIAGEYLRHGQPDTLPECISQWLASVFSQRHLKDPPRLQYKHAILKSASSSNHNIHVCSGEASLCE